jgi:hypothetical protein
MSLMLLGHLRLAEGDPDGARAELIESAGLFTSTGNMVYLPWCLEAGFEAAHARLAGRPPPELIAAVTEEETVHE